MIYHRVQEQWEKQPGRDASLTGNALRVMRKMKGRRVNKTQRHSKTWKLNNSILEVALQPCCLLWQPLNVIDWSTTTREENLFVGLQYGHLLPSWLGTSSQSTGFQAEWLHRIGLGCISLISAHKVTECIRGLMRIILVESKLSQLRIGG